MKSRPKPSSNRLKIIAMLVAAASVGSSGALRAQRTDGKASATLSKPAAARQVDVPRLPVTRFVLKNGLTVLLSEDHSSPIVGIYVAYHVGSKDEAPGKRGFAHLFEHMMFHGSAHVESDEHTRIIQQSGGVSNASTDADETTFYERVPSNMLETALWLEADRMAFLPARFDSAHFETERSAVINEFGRVYDARPVSALSLGGGMLGPDAMAHALFPDPSPYHTAPFGVMSELKAMSLGDMRAFFDKYYVPNNATLVLVGDFETADARKMIERNLGGIPRGAPVTHPKADNAPLTKETRIVIEDRTAPTRQLWVGWRGASMTSPDRTALLALMGVLNGGSGARLSRVLVTERKVASALPPMPDNGLFDMESAGWLGLIIAPTTNASLTDVERVLDSVVADVRDNGVSRAELQRWLSFFAVSSVTQLQRALDKGDLLQQGEVLYRNPNAKLTDIDEARKLTPADLQRVARKYLGAGRVVMSVVPAGRVELRSKPDAPYTNVTRAKP